MEERIKKMRYFYIAASTEVFKTRSNFCDEAIQQNRKKIPRKCLIGS